MSESQLERAQTALPAKRGIAEADLKRAGAEWDNTLGDPRKPSRMDAGKFCDTTL